MVGVPTHSGRPSPSPSSKRVPSPPAVCAGASQFVDLWMSERGMGRQQACGGAAGMRGGSRHGGRQQACVVQQARSKARETAGKVESSGPEGSRQGRKLETRAAGKVESSGPEGYTQRRGCSRSSCPIDTWPRSRRGTWRARAGSSRRAQTSSRRSEPPRHSSPPPGGLRRRRRRAWRSARRLLWARARAAPIRGEHR